MRVLVTDKVSTQGVSVLQKEFDVDVRNELSPEELLAVIPEYDALIVRSETKVTKAVLEAGTRLKVVGRAGVGVDNIDVQAATQQGVMVLNAPDGNTIAATELTMAMMASLARNVPQAYRSMKDGKWERSKFMGVELRGKTLGIVGLGRIGAGVAKRAQVLEMNILAYDPFLSAERAKDMGIKLADLDEIYANADFMTLHVPLIPETKHLLNKEAFAKMKKGMRIVQCSRGGVIEENALYEALQDGTVAGAALDVFEKEPVDPNNPLLTLDNIIFTPHLGASTKEAQVNVAIDVAEAVAAALKGEPVTSAVNAPAVTAQVMQFIRPYLVLAEKMGMLAAQLSEGRIEDIEVQYNGEISGVDTKMLTIAAVKGVLSPALQESVNYVNAQIVAKSRGITVTEVRSQEVEHFANLISVRVMTDRCEHRVAGTLFGRTEGRIVVIDKTRVNVEPEGWLLIMPHTDNPGMVGKVGTVLGENDLNITSMKVGRTREAGTNIMVVGVETEIPEAVRQEIAKLDGVYGVQAVNLAARGGAR